MLKDFSEKGELFVLGGKMISATQLSELMKKMQFRGNNEDNRRKSGISNRKEDFSRDKNKLKPG